VPLAGIANRTLRAKGIAQDRQLLLHCPTAPTRNDLNPSAHTTARMSTHMTAHWSTFDLVIHCRSYPSGNQPFIPQPRKAASAPRLPSFSAFADMFRPSTISARHRE
jgi:hypothetical protein